MDIHWPSFLLGLAALPFLLGFVALLLQLLGKLIEGALPSRSSNRALSGSGSSAPRLEPLEFNPRLIGQIRDRLAPSEDSAKAS